MRLTTPLPALAAILIGCTGCTPRSQEDPKPAETTRSTETATARSTEGPTETMEPRSDTAARPAPGWITMRWTAGIRLRARRPDGTSRSVREASATATFTVSETPPNPAAARVVPIELELGDGLRLCLRIDAARVGSRGDRRWLDMSGAIRGNWTRTYGAASAPPRGRIDAPVTSSVFPGEPAPIDILDNQFLGGDDGLEYQVFSQREVMRVGGPDDKPAVAPTPPVAPDALGLDDRCRPTRVLRRVEDVPARPATPAEPAADDRPHEEQP